MDGLGGMGHGGAVVKTLELFTPDGTIMTHIGLAENDQNSPKSQKHSTSVEFQCKIEF